jgi:hypothetical protein
MKRLFELLALLIAFAVGAAALYWPLTIFVLASAFSYNWAWLAAGFPLLLPLLLLAQGLAPTGLPYAMMQQGLSGSLIVGVCAALVIVVTVALSPRFGRVREVLGRHRRQSVVVAGVWASLLAVGLLWHIDLHPFPRTAPPHLPERQVLERGGRFYRAGGFIDQTYLWRASVEPGGVQAVAASLGAAEVEAIPPEFFSYPPYWSPKKAAPSFRAFASPDFPVRGRGLDGRHYFLVYDPDAETLYAWVLDNF